MTAIDSIKIRLDGDDIFIVKDFLSLSDCNALIAKSEEIGFGLPTVETGHGREVNASVRNNGHATWEDEATATRLFDMARDFLPDPFKGKKLDGLHQRLRFYRYESGQTFKKHRDGAMESDDHKSLLTFLIYLNEGCKGGETIFYEDGTGPVSTAKEQLRVNPEQGTLLVFNHSIIHEGAPVTAGVKYVVRSDLMYCK